MNEASSAVQSRAQRVGQKLVVVPFLSTVAWTIAMILRHPHSIRFGSYTGTTTHLNEPLFLSVLAGTILVAAVIHVTVTVASKNTLVASLVSTALLLVGATGALFLAQSEEHHSHEVSTPVDF